MPPCPFPILEACLVLGFPSSGLQKGLLAMSPTSSCFPRLCFCLLAPNRQVGPSTC